MEDKDVETIVKESYDKVAVRDFSDVWAEIQDEIIVKPKKRRTWQLVSAAAVAACVLCLSILLPILSRRPLPSKPLTFFDDKFSVQTVSFADLTAGLDEAAIDVVDFTKFEVVACSLYVTDEAIVKGGNVDIVEKSDAPMFFGTIRVYANDVAISGTEDFVPDGKYFVNGATIQYKLTGRDEAMNSFKYEIHATQNSVQYRINYMGFTEDVKSFLDLLFS